MARNDFDAFVAAQVVADLPGHVTTQAIVRPQRISVSNDQDL